MISGILGLFVNKLTANEKYSLRNWKNLQQLIRILLSQKQKGFSQCFDSYLKLQSNSDYFLKKTTLIVYVFPKVEAAKDEVI